MKTLVNNTADRLLGRFLSSSAVGACSSLTGKTCKCVQVLACVPGCDKAYWEKYVVSCNNQCVYQEDVCGTCTVY